MARGAISGQRSTYHLTTVRSLANTRNTRRTQTAAMPGAMGLQIPAQAATIAMAVRHIICGNVCIRPALFMSLEDINPVSSVFQRARAPPDSAILRFARSRIYHRNIPLSLRIANTAHYAAYNYRNARRAHYVRETLLRLIDAGEFIKIRALTANVYFH